jgi:hypothetical protein
MPTFASWERADIIAALALLVSSLAFIASAVSSLVTWRTYLASKSARRPTLRVYFEPFVNSAEWWITNLSIRNRSENVLAFDSIRIIRPWGAQFSTFLGGFAGSSSGGLPMAYDLPDEVLTAGTERKLTSLDEEALTDVEFPPSNDSVHLGSIITKMPNWSFSRHVLFRIEMRELGEFPKQIAFDAAALFPTKQNTKARY